MRVTPGDPRAREATALLQASHALMQSLFPAEDNHYLSIDDLCAPDIRFFIASDETGTIGCGALKRIADYGEVKSMFTAERGRGKGVASAILTRIEEEARSQKLSSLKLETGNTLHAAHRLYARHGFTPCGPFGDYGESPSSLFMAKPL